MHPYVNIHTDTQAYTYAQAHTQIQTRTHTHTRIYHIQLGAHTARRYKYTQENHRHTSKYLSIYRALNIYIYIQSSIDR